MSNLTPQKRKMVKIGTHDGTFHCDEALGCFLLQRTKEFKGADIVRSRVPAVLAELDVVIDVGAVYDPDTKRFDHHQKEFAEVFGHGFVTKLSSAGLVYKHYGKEIVATVLGLEESDPIVDKIYLKVYKSFIEAVDGIDNGISMWDSDQPPKYTNSTDLSSRVGKLHPAWNEDDSAEVYYKGFLKAVELTGFEFLDSVNYFGKVWLPGRKYVVDALNARHSVHPSGEVIQLSQYCPWKEHLHELEEEMNVEPNIKYCLYEDDKKNWRIQTVSVGPGSFVNRRGLPTAWRGIRDADLDAVSGVPGCIFVHAAGFIGGNKTLEGAKQMAYKALEME